MKKSPVEPTTSKNLEEKFNRSQDVLDYFDVAKAQVVEPKTKGSITEPTFAYPVKRKNSKRPAVVREKSANYRNKR